MHPRRYGDIDIDTKILIDFLRYNPGYFPEYCRVPCTTSSSTLPGITVRTAVVLRLSQFALSESAGDSANLNLNFRQIRVSVLL